MARRGKCGSRASTGWPPQTPRPARPKYFAGPYDFDFDPNWPESKRFRVLEVPEHLPLGSRLIGSDEHGMRAEFEIVERDGARGLQRTSTPVSHPTADIWRKAHEEAKVLAGRPPSSH